jgi:hypothetical protein
MSGRKIKAWVVTWGSVDNPERPCKVVAILNPQLSGNHVRELVEFLYLSWRYTLSEQVRCAVSRKNPYPAHFPDIDGVPWSGEVYCGHNPVLHARLVADLAVKCDERGKETATWKEAEEYYVGEKYNFLDK